MVLLYMISPIRRAKYRNLVRFCCNSNVKYFASVLVQILSILLESNTLDYGTAVNILPHKSAENVIMVLYDEQYTIKVNNHYLTGNTSFIVNPCC